MLVGHLKNLLAFPRCTAVNAMNKLVNLPRLVTLPTDCQQPMEGNE
jgi:hypothetical protein